VIGLNFSPSLFNPIDALDDALAEARVDEADPVCVLVHLTCPVLAFRDPGKTMLALPEEIEIAVREKIASVTKQWRDAKRRADRDHRMQRRDLDRLRRGDARGSMSIKDAVWSVMADAYQHASSGGTLPVLARGLMYAVRERVLAIPGVRIWKDADYFTQRLLPDYLKAYPDDTTDWDIVFDDRGHYHEPHTGQTIGLGTMAVREYRDGWIHGVPPVEHTIVSHRYPTSGPTNRHGAVLFIEKETFIPLFEAVHLAERFDLALMSSKGYASTAGRELVEAASQAGARIFVLHDFDADGLGIVHTLKEDTNRYAFGTTPHVIDLGLRLAVVRERGLPSEAVSYKKGDPRIILAEHGATAEEIAVLVTGREGGRWVGQRTELNAFSQPDLIAWLEEELTAHDVGKVVPRTTILEDAWRRAARARHIQRAIDEAEATWTDDGVVIPANLGATIRSRIAGTDVPWDDVVDVLVAGEERATTQEESDA
jgi:hypothetical protein